MTSGATTLQSPGPATTGTYTPPTIPSSIGESFQAWVRSKPARDAAEAELHLFKQRSSYFEGAHVGNARNDRLDRAWRQMSAAQDNGGEMPAAQREQEKEKEKVGMRGTMGTRLNEDGKIGAIRLVDIDQSPSAGSAWLSFSGKAPRQINMLEVGDPNVSPDDQVTWEKEEKVVLLHGYGAGMGFYFSNIAGLAAHTPPKDDSSRYTSSRFFALDWLGMGRSARVPFHVSRNGNGQLLSTLLSSSEEGGANAHADLPPNFANLSPEAQATIARVKAAESFFVDSLEAWRKVMGIEKMTVIGHSIGGYLSLAYTLKYPERVQRLVLISPAAIGPNPDEEEDTFAPKNLKEQVGTQDAAAEIAGEDSKRENLAPSSQAQASKDTKNVERQASDTKARKKALDDAMQKAAQKEQDREAETGTPPKAPPRIGKNTRRFFTFLWEQNFSPFSILRNSFFFGPMLTARYTTRRFGALPDEELRSMHAYSHGIFTSKGSSEYALGHLLAPGAYARWPMVNRIHPIKVPVSFIYGQHDWMDVKAGRLACQALKDAGNPNGSCFVVPSAGHHVYLDNAQAHDKLVRKILRGEADGQK